MKRPGNLFTKPYFSIIDEWIQILPEVKRYHPDLILISAGKPGSLFFPFFINVPMVYLLRTIPKKKGWKSSLFYAIPKRFAGKHKRIATVSKCSADSIHSAWGVPKEFIHVIHNSFDSENVSKMDRRVESDLKIVLTLGHVKEYKNPELWLQVAKMVTENRDDVRFIWLGDGPILQHYRELCANEKRIDFLGHKTNADEYYSKATIYFQPSILENHGRAILDAMANRLPCVVSSAGGNPESITDGMHGFICDIHDTGCYSSKIRQLLNDPKLSDKIGELAKERAFSEFHPDQFRKKLLNVYQKVML